MAKKKPARRTAPKKRPTPKAPEPQSEAATQETIEDRLRAAREEMKRAREYYRQAREQAAEQTERFKRMTMGEVLDGGTDFVKRHPILGVSVAAVLGFYAGKWFRR